MVNKMRVCDYIADRLAFYGVKRVYGIMGGGAATLNDGFIKNPDIDAVIISSSTPFHADYAIAAAKEGKAIFCEKKFAFLKC